MKGKNSSAGQDPGIPDILREIIASKRDEIAAARRMLPEFRAKIRSLPPPLDFQRALRPCESPSIIAEIKRASPSAGMIAEDFDPVRTALLYSEAGCDAISVITEKNRFLGDPSFIPAVKKKVKIPVLRKDFIADASQIYESRALGADSFLLIVAALDKSSLGDFIESGRGLGMEPLVEVHSESELETAVSAGASIIGVNSRDLRSFKVDLGTALRLVKLMPPGKPRIAESGIADPVTAAELFNAGFTGFLIGEALMRNPGGAADFIGKTRKIRRI